MYDVDPEYRDYGALSCFEVGTDGNADSAVKFQHEITLIADCGPSLHHGGFCLCTERCRYMLKKSLRLWRCISRSIARQNFQTEYQAAPFLTSLTQRLMSSKVRGGWHVASHRLTHCQGVLLRQRVQYHQRPRYKYRPLSQCSRGFMESWKE